MSLKHAILGLLSLQPLTGYDLKRTMDRSVRHFWTGDQAAIYRALRDLERQQMVAHERVPQESRPDRKIFSLTDTGRSELDTWLASPTESSPRREPLLVKLFFAARISPYALHNLLQVELRSVEAELAELVAYVDQVSQSLQRESADIRNAQLGPLLTLSNGLHLGRSYRDWLRELLRKHNANELIPDQLMQSLHVQLAEFRRDSMTDIVTESVTESDSLSES